MQMKLKFSSKKERESDKRVLKNYQIPFVASMGEILEISQQKFTCSFSLIADK